MEMTIILPLEPEKQAKLVALAQSKGRSADDLVREAIEKMPTSR
jgi:predicted DNA-binding protein